MKILLCTCIEHIDLELKQNKDCRKIIGDYLHFHGELMIKHVPVHNTCDPILVMDAGYNLHACS